MQTILCWLGFHDWTAKNGTHRLDCPIDPGICERCFNCGWHGIMRHNPK